MQHRSLVYSTILSVPFAFLASSCDRDNAAASGDETAVSHERAHAVASAPAGVTRAVCVLAATAGNSAAGTLHLAEQGGVVTIRGDVSGLAANQRHAIHIHEFGDVSSADGTAAGSHYNPEGHDHGLPESAKRHAGDFGNLQADGGGRASLSLSVDNITLAGAKNPVIGRAIIVHADEDDGGQPVGNAGSRIAQCVIGIANAGAAASAV